MDAFLFDGAAKGIVKQAVTGAGVTFLGTADQITRELPGWDGDVGWAYLGAFYTAAPFPLKSLTKAADLFKTLVDKAPASRRNHYYSGVVALRRDRWAEAREHFSEALRQKCGSLTELDFCAYMEEQARLGLVEAESHTQRP
mmetsp:Transcript_15110/g.39772  ORF Transcript_15110/g.39772 Transcript_15110/m.39772 type:complete len:142 (+) Transcript_15110:141-566(+)